MKILIFTEGTIIMHSSDNKIEDYASYIPVKNAVSKVKQWKNQGYDISYITSRQTPEEVKIIEDVLEKHNFPEGTLYFRKEDEEYKDVVARVKPNILIEDNCESIGAEEIICHHLDPALKITCIVVPEFGGIDHLPDILSPK